MLTIQPASCPALSLAAADVSRLALSLSFAWICALVYRGDSPKRGRFFFVFFYIVNNGDTQLAVGSDCQLVVSSGIIGIGGGEVFFF